MGVASTVLKSNSCDKKFINKYKKYKHRHFCSNRLLTRVTVRIHFKNEFPWSV